MQILHINNDYYSPFYRLYLDALNEAGAERGQRSFVAVFTRRGTAHAPEENVMELPVLGCLDRFLYFYKQRRSCRALEAAGAVRGCALCHAHFLFSGGGVALRLKQKYGVPYITAVCNTDMNLFFRYMPHLRPFGLRVVREAEQVIALSPAYADKLLSYVPAPERAAVAKKLRVIPLGIDPYWLTHTRIHTREAGERRVRLVFAGRMDKNKNPAATAQACDLLRARGYDAHFTAVGPVKDAAYTKALRRRPGVTCLPRMDRERLAALYETQDIFIMPSIAESFGLVYAEAMSQGLPVVYTRGQGFDGQFPEGQAGYAVDCHDPAAIADAVERILADYNAMSERCARLAQKFDWTRIAADYAALYAAVGKSGEGEGERT